MSRLGSQLFGPASTLDQLFGLLVEIIENRLKILSLELREEKIHFVQIFVLASIVVFLAVLSVVAIAATAIYAIPAESRLLGLVIATGVFVVATLILALVLVRKLGRHPIPFARTISEMTRGDE
jgi:uncharacterized membrane protein YqjE